MKTIKIVLLVASISFFTLIPFSAEAKDCSIYKSAVQKKLCETMAGISSGNTTTSDKDSEFAISTEKQKEKVKSFWKKFKNIGGENLGEPG